MDEGEAAGSDAKIVVFEETEGKCPFDVQVNATAVDLESLKSFGKVFTIKSREYPMSSFGTWACQEVTSPDDLKSLETCGIMAMLTWGFLQIHPEIDVWVKGLEELSFTFHVRQSQQKDMLRRISSGAMAKDLEKELRQRLPNSCGTLRIKLIKILCGTVKKHKREGNKDEVEQIKSLSTSVESGAIGALMNIGDFGQAYVRLKRLIENDITDVARLELLIRLAICIIQLKKIEETGEAYERVLKHLNKAEIPESKILFFYMDIANLRKLLDMEGLSLYSAKVGLAFSRFIRKIPNMGQRLDAFTSNLISSSIAVKTALLRNPMISEKHEIQACVKKIQKEVECLKKMTGCNQLRQSHAVYISLYLVDTIEKALRQSEGVDIFGLPDLEYPCVESSWVNFDKVFSKISQHPELKSHLSDATFLGAIEEISRQPSLLEKRILDPRIAKVNELLNGEFHLAKPMSASTRIPIENPPNNAIGGSCGGREDQGALSIDKKKEAQDEKEKGNKAYKNKEFEKALAHYDKAIELNPSDGLLHTNKASVYMEQGQLSNAESCCFTAIRIAQTGDNMDNKDVAKVVARLARVEFLSNHHDAALALYQKSLYLNQSDRVRQDMKQCEKAILSPRFSDFLKL